MTDASCPKFKIAVFGRSDDLWSAVLSLSNSLPSYFEFVAIEESCSFENAASTTLPYGSAFLKRLGITEKDILAQCNGTFGLGTECQDWRGNGSRYFAAPSGLLPTINNIRLHQLVLCIAQMHGEPEKLADLYQAFRFCARTAEAQKFAFQSTSSQSPTAMLGPILQFDTGLYASLLKKRFKNSGAITYDGVPISQTLFKETGHIKSVQLETGSFVDADLFIDLSGRLSSLANDRDESGFQSLTHILPFDKVVSEYQDEVNETKPHMKARAFNGGVTIETPFQRGMNSATLFSAEHLKEETLSGLSKDGANVRPFKAGYWKKSWIGNSITLGQASAQFGPYFSADKTYLRLQIKALIENFPSQALMQAEANAFNKRVASIRDEIRDFTLLPFALNDRAEPLWQNIKASAFPDSLQTRIMQFQSRGRFALYDQEVFDEQIWIDTFIGFGIVPNRYDPMVRSLDMQKIMPTLQAIVNNMSNTINTLVTHEKAVELYLQE